MKRLFALIALAFLAGGILLSGCSREDTSPGAESKTVSEEAAEKIEKKITDPLDKARAAQDLGEERTEAIDRALEEQAGK